MPTLPNRLLRQNRPSLSSDRPYIENQVEDYFGRSPDEPDLELSHESKYSRLPSFSQYPAQRSESSVRNSKSHARSRSHPFPSLFGAGRKRGESLSSKARDTQVFLDEDEDEDDDDYAPQLDGSSSPGGKKIMPMDPRRMEERDFETEHCMACDSTVKRPKGHKSFRCASCLTINDLERWDRQSLSRGRYDQPASTEEGTTRSHTVRKPVLLSPNRLQDLIERCTTDYLRYRFGIKKPEPDNRRRIDKQTIQGPRSELLNDRDGRKDEHTVLKQSVAQESQSILAGDQILSEDLRSPYPTEPSINAKRPPFDGSVRDHKSCQEETRSANVSASPTRSSSQQKDRPLPMRLRSGSSEHVYTNKAQKLPRPIAENIVEQANYEIGKSYFNPLEDHINTSYRNAECLNASFVTGRISYAERARSEGFVGSVRNTRPAPSVSAASESFSELDPKTLLLADVAENGSWWTGRPQRLQQSPERISGMKYVPESARSYIINYRSARINWHDVSRWYTMVCNVDRSWQAVWEKILGGAATQRSEKSLQNSEDLTQIESELRLIRHHFRRVLLRATEELLKRPGFPLRDPDNTRFLLILLANPLLYTSDIGVGVLAPGKPSQLTGRQKDANFGPTTSHSRGSEAGVFQSSSKLSRSYVHTFDIVKRILGLLSNLPAQCHNRLVSWFIRYDEERFQNTVDLVARFVTYRLSRQSGKKPTTEVDPTAHLIPELTGSTANSTAQLHAALELGRNSSQKKENKDGTPQIAAYSEDWQLAAAAKVMALLFAANNMYYLKRPSESIGGRDNINDDISKRARSIQEDQRQRRQKEGPTAHGQLLSTSHFYNSLLDYIDLITDFETWQSKQAKFTFTQFHFFIPIGAKTKIMEFDARRQMGSKARDAFFDSIFRNRNVEQFFQLRVRRNCLIEDSLGRISEVVGAGQQEVKKALRVQFAGEEGVDAGGLRKEWFLLLVRELIDPNNGMFLYDEDSHLCYFNPNTWEKSEQYFLVGAVVGLAMYNSTILDIPFPPFAFRKLLGSASMASSIPSVSSSATGLNRRHNVALTLDDLADYRPRLAKGLQDLLEFEGDVETTYCWDFVIETDRYGEKVKHQLCPDGDKRPLTNKNRHEFVDLYVRYLLDTSVDRQFAPFQRGFYTVCSGKVMNLFRPEEIELLVRGSDEALDILTLKAVAIYENWPEEEEEEEALDRKNNMSTPFNNEEHFNRKPTSPRHHTQQQQQHRNHYTTQADKRSKPMPKAVSWFWELFESANAQDQRKILGFITGSDRIPAQGPASLVIKIVCAGEDCERFPVARTCFNMIMLYQYRSRRKLVEKLWRAVVESEGFGLK